MAFDPSVLQDIQPPDIVGGIAKGFQLKDMVDTQQLNQLKLNQEKTRLADDQKAKGILSSSKLNTSEGLADAQEKLTRAGLPDKAMELRKYGQQIESGELENKLKRVDLAVAAHGITDNGINKIWQQATAMKNEKTADGRPRYTDASINAWIQGQIPAEVSSIQSDSGLPQEVKGMALQNINKYLANGQPMTYDALTGLVRGSEQGRKMLTEMRQDLVAQTGAKREAETERHNRENEEHARRMEANRGGGKTNEKQQAVYAAMADLGIAFPPGMRSVKAQRDTIDGLIAAHPDDSAVQIASRVKAGELGTAGAKTALNVVERREGASAAAINALNRGGGLYDQLQETAKKVDFGSAKFKNNFSLWKQGKAVADPDISEYVNALADTRAEFASVLARGGQVTDSVRIASEHAFPDSMSLSELNRNVERSKKIADAIQAGNTSVADAIIHGKSLDAALKESQAGSKVTGTDHPQISSNTDYENLPSGSIFIDPDGKQRRKP